MHVSRGCIVVVTCVVLWKEQNGVTRALILKRSAEEQEGPGLWTIPGGKVRDVDLGEPKETSSHRIWRGVLERALVREVYEETGISVEPEHFFPLKEGDSFFERKDGTPTLVTTHYVFFWNKPDVRLDKDATGYLWASEEELEKYLFIGGVRGDIKKVLAAVRYSLAGG